MRDFQADPILQTFFPNKSPVALTARPHEQYLLRLYPSPRKLDRWINCIKGKPRGLMDWRRHHPEDALC
jgi:hypothetical protein